MGKQERKFFVTPEHGDLQLRKELDEGYSDRTKLSTRQRLLLMYRFEADGTPSPELKTVASSTQVSLVAGFAYGVITKFPVVYQRFIDDNKHTMFESPRRAQTALRHDIWKHCGINGAKVGCGLGLVVFAYTFGTQSANAIQNDITGHGHAIVGSVLGFLLTFSRGPKGFAAGTLIGGACGLLEGLTMKTIIYLKEGSYEKDMLKRYEKVKKAQELDFERKRKKEFHDNVIEKDSSIVMMPLGDDPIRDYFVKKLRKFKYGEE